MTRWLAATALGGTLIGCLFGMTLAQLDDPPRLGSEYAIFEDGSCGRK